MDDRRSTLWEEGQRPEGLQGTRRKVHRPLRRKKERNYERDGSQERERCDVDKRYGRKNSWHGARRGLGLRKEVGGKGRWDGASVFVARQCSESFYQLSPKNEGEGGDR